MTIINVTNARNKLYSLIEGVNESAEPVTIVNNKGKNAVLISEDDWHAIQETIYLNSIPGIADRIREGMEQPLSECVSEEEVDW